jgi:hypothetical protein
MIWSWCRANPVLTAIWIAVFALTGTAAMRWPAIASANETKAEITDLMTRRSERERDLAVTRQKLAALSVPQAKDHASLVALVENDLKQALQSGHKLTGFATEAGKADGQLIELKALVNLEISHGSAVDLMARLGSRRPGWTILQASLKPVANATEPRQALTLNILASAIRTAP